MPKQKKRKPIQRLPKSPNGVKRKSASFGAYQYQKDTLKRRAHQKKMTVSLYLNTLLWKDWL